MYFVERSRDEIVVKGPDGWERTLPANGVILEECEGEGWIRKIPVSISELSADLAAYALDLEEY